MNAILDTIRAERSKHGTPLGEEGAWQTINAVAYTWQHEGWRLLRKDSGTRYVVDGTGYSIDVLVNPSTREAVDCLISSETDGVPSWSPIPWLAEFAERAMFPIPPEPEAPSEPLDPPGPGEWGDRLATLELRLRSIESALRRLGMAMPAD